MIRDILVLLLVMKVTLLVAECVTETMQLKRQSPSEDSVEITFNIGSLVKRSLL